jgi:hypothetical protein
VVRFCVEEGVPIYHGKIDKSLFQAQLEGVGSDEELALLRSSLLPRRSPAGLRRR